MPKVGLVVATNAEDSHLSTHFGVAKWILIADTETGERQLVRNEALSGQGVVEILATHGCTDVILGGIGDGALAHLRRAGIRGWYGPADQPVVGVLSQWRAGGLQPAEQPSHASHHRHHHHHHHHHGG